MRTNSVTITASVTACAMNAAATQTQNLGSKRFLGTSGLTT